jgi:hypothetical protein
VAVLSIVNGFDGEFRSLLLIEMVGWGPGVRSSITANWKQIHREEDIAPNQPSLACCPGVRFFSIKQKRLRFLPYLLPDLNLGGCGSNHTHPLSTERVSVQKVKKSIKATLNIVVELYSSTRAFNSRRRPYLLTNIGVCDLANIHHSAPATKDNAEIIKTVRASEAIFTHYIE